MLKQVGIAVLSTIVAMVVYEKFVKGMLAPKP